MNIAKSQQGCHFSALLVIVLVGIQVLTDLNDMRVLMWLDHINLLHV